MNYTIEDYYYASYLNVIDMCKDRNYTTKTKSFEDLKISKSEFSEKFKDHETNPTILDILPGTLYDENKLPVYVTFIEQSRENKAFIGKIFQGIYNALKQDFNLTKDAYKNELFENVHCIILHNQEQKTGSHYHHNLEFFCVKKFFINVTRHSVVPKHILLKESEKKEIFESKNMSYSTCPKIFSNDPVNLYYNGQINNVYKIIRDSKSFYLRVVTPVPGKVSQFINDIHKFQARK
jgi:DNA-directed RNA polymerase subunit H (RpoH/RPB5)